MAPNVAAALNPCLRGPYAFGSGHTALTPLRLPAAVPHRALRVDIFCSSRDGSAAERGLSSDSQKLRHRRCALKHAANVAKNDATVISRGLLSLDERARSDVAILDERAKSDVARLESTILQLDAQAKESTEALDARARSDVKRLRLIMLGLDETARVQFSPGSAAQRWSTTRLRLRRRLLEDSFGTVQAVRGLHQQLVGAVRGGSCPQRQRSAPPPAAGRQGQWAAAPASPRVLRPAYRRAEALQDLFSFLGQHPILPPEGNATSSSRGHQEWGSGAEESRAAGALPGATGSGSAPPSGRRSERQRGGLAEQQGGWDQSDSSAAWVEEHSAEELEFLLAALLDMDGISSAYGASLLRAAVLSPSPQTRMAVATALHNAPSVACLGNVGLGALQRLAADVDAEVAAEARAALVDLQEQWRQEQQQQQ